MEQYCSEQVRLVKMGCNLSLDIPLLSIKEVVDIPTIQGIPNKTGPEIKLFIYSSGLNYWDKKNVIEIVYETTLFECIMIVCGECTSG